MRKGLVVVGSIALVTSLGLAAPVASQENDDVSVRSAATVLPATAAAARPKKTECATNDPAWVRDGIRIMQSPNDDITPEFFSLEIAPEITSPVDLNPGGYQRLWDMGVAWKDVNPSEGVFDWSVLDQRVAQAQAGGAMPMYVLGLTPSWAASSDAGDTRWGIGTASAPKDLNMWRTYVRAVAERYNGSNGHGLIAAFEVWNEANIVTFWDNGNENSPDPFGMGTLAEMTKIAYDEIKAVSPWATVISATTTTRVRGNNDFFGGPQSRYWYYLQALKERDYPFDAWGIHSYPAGNAGPTQRIADVLCWQEIVVRHFGQDVVNQLERPSLGGIPRHPIERPIFDTEVNFGFAGPGSAVPGVSYDGDIAQRLIWRAYIDSARLGIDSTTWYLHSAGPYSINGEVVGVQMYGNTAAVSAYRQVRSALLPDEDDSRDSKFLGCSNLSPDGSYSVLSCAFTGFDVFGASFLKGDGSYVGNSFIAFAEDVFSQGTPTVPFTASTSWSLVPAASQWTRGRTYTSLTGAPVAVLGIVGTEKQPPPLAPIFTIKSETRPRPNSVKITWGAEPRTRNLTEYINAFEWRIEACARKKCEVLEEDTWDNPNREFTRSFDIPRTDKREITVKVRSVSKWGKSPWATWRVFKDRTRRGPIPPTPTPTPR